MDSSPPDPGFPQEIAEEPSLAGPHWYREVYDRQLVDWCVAVLLIRRYPTTLGASQVRVYLTRLRSQINQFTHHRDLSLEL